MWNSMSVSEIRINDLVEYLRLDETKVELFALLDAAKAFIKSYTGLDDTEIDKHEDFVIVIYILVEDMYDNRTLYVDKNNLNKVVDTILGMHSANLL
jgi:hypothetical protein